MKGTNELTVIKDESCQAMRNKVNRMKTTTPMNRQKQINIETKILPSIRLKMMAKR